MLGEVFRRYKNTSLRTRFFLILRWLLTPYSRMAEFLPDRGNFIDLGCGHGLMAFAMAKNHPERKIVGVDHDEERVRAADSAFKDLSNLKFKVGSFSIADRYRAIVALDVLHYFTEAEQKEIFRSISEHLERGGTFLFREVNIDPDSFSIWNRLHEKIMTSIEFTKAERLHYQTKEKWTSMAVAEGFQVRSLKMSCFPYVDQLYVCEKH